MQTEGIKLLQGESVALATMFNPLVSAQNVFVRENSCVSPRMVSRSSTCFPPHALQSRALCTPPDTPDLTIPPSPHYRTSTDHAEIYSGSPSHRRECSYYIAVGYFKLRQYANAKRFNGELGVCVVWLGTRGMSGVHEAQRLSTGLFNFTRAGWSKDLLSSSNLACQVLCSRGVGEGFVVPLSGCLF